MKVVQFEDVTPVRGLEHRGGTFHSRTTAAGEPGTPGNFKFSVSELGTDYSGPRHRHNFEQYRFMLAGESDYGQDGPLKAGMLGYYPEGVPYGPQVNKTPIVCAVLQFGGASGSGYLSQAEVQAGMQELKQEGEFRDGVFRRRADVEGKRNLDGYQAIWEHVNERPMVYPKPRYPQPIFMDPASYEWVPVEGQPGVAEKLLGVFTERRAEASFVRLEPGATWLVSGRGIYVATSGRGRVAGAPLRAFTTLFLDHGEQASFAADEESEILHFGLPDLRSLAAHGEDFAPAVAAE